jgi:mono/diheme cytochrome c family protein
MKNLAIFLTLPLTVVALALNCPEATRAQDELAAANATHLEKTEIGPVAIAVSQQSETPKAKDGRLDESPPVQPAFPTYLRDVLPIFMGKCAKCHGDSGSVLPNWLDYETAFGDRSEIKRRVWHSWKGSYYKQPMPAGNGLESQTMTEDERQTVKRWVENGAPRGVPPGDSGFHSKAEKIELGKRLYGAVCGVCHQPTGQGIPTRFPPLAGSDLLNADKQRAIKIVLHGLQGELVVNGREFNNAMPRFPLNDQDIANVLTYVYNSFGNSGKEVTSDEVRAARADKDAPVDAQSVQKTKVADEKSPFE